MNSHPAVVLAAILTSKGKPPHKAATLATYICRLGKSVAKIRLAEQKGELVTGERDWHTRNDGPDEYQEWNNAVNRDVTLKGEAVNAKVDTLNDELRTLDLLADGYGAGGLRLTVSGKDEHGFPFTMSTT